MIMTNRSVVGLHFLCLSNEKLENLGQNKNSGYEYYDTMMNVIDLLKLKMI